MMLQTVVFMWPFVPVADSHSDGLSHEVGTVLLSLTPYCFLLLPCSILSLPHPAVLLPNLPRKLWLPLHGKVILFNRARSFGRDAHGAVREEGDTRLASQISRINPGDQWGDRCRRSPDGPHIPKLNAVKDLEQGVQDIRSSLKASEANTFWPEPNWALPGPRFSMSVRVRRRRGGAWTTGSGRGARGEEPRGSPTSPPPTPRRAAAPHSV
ncbi:hypothetical protein TREES_T100019494 [Tupaia chinensis]|uniref:Uncharacterized protein n=1 Tax=Tupaia chinensis TaxID=246437 RepID=L9KHD7_TUPCH|nr:hypothetical protein TREES_T100019494 [Tupaia chinensis]